MVTVNYLQQRLGWDLPQIGKILFKYYVSDVGGVGWVENNFYCATLDIQLTLIFLKVDFIILLPSFGDLLFAG